jgi:hypothetical protein
LVMMAKVLMIRMCRSIEAGRTEPRFLLLSLPWTGHIGL